LIDDVQFSGLYTVFNGRVPVVVAVEDFKVAKTHLKSAFQSL